MKPQARLEKGREIILLKPQEHQPDIWWQISVSMKYFLKSTVFEFLKYASLPSGRTLLSQLQTLKKYIYIYIHIYICICIYIKLCSDSIPSLSSLLPSLLLFQCSLLNASFLGPTINFTENCPAIALWLEQGQLSFTERQHHHISPKYWEKHYAKRKDNFLLFLYSVGNTPIALIPVKVPKDIEVFLILSSMGIFSIEVGLTCKKNILCLKIKRKTIQKAPIFFEIPLRTIYISILAFFL